MDGLLNAAMIYLWAQVIMGGLVFLALLFIVLVAVWSDR